MKTLYLTRHAKSSWKDSSLKDFDRPLNARGRRDAPMMAEKLLKMGVYRPYLLSSTAVRAKTTAQTFAHTFNIPLAEIDLRDEIYEADAEDLVSIIRNIDSEVDRLMVFGHNPEFTWLGNRLGKLYLDNIPTTGVLALGFDTSEWSDIDFGKGKLLFFVYPKLFLNAD